MKSVYIETSIVSYLTARPSPDVRAAAWQQLTVQWWEQEKPKYELFTSELVLAEPAAGDCEAAQRRRNPLSDPYVLLQDTPVPKSVHRWNCFLRRLKMYKDDIITEVRQNRDAYAREHHYNLDEIVADLRKREQSHPGRVVARRTSLAPASKTQK
jgi:hypothetical protein